MQFFSINKELDQKTHDPIMHKAHAIPTRKHLGSDQQLHNATNDHFPHFPNDIKIPDVETKSDTLSTETIPVIQKKIIT